MTKRQMIINYVQGEECRVAIAEDHRLEEYYAERLDGPSNHVGNIYVGKVVNVEPAIQAAFIDFGLSQNGFLHVSDVHPQYFPGEDAETTERVGKKTPRRDRPPIQDCFRRGDEVAVQVLKEGVGTKGPTVTSYLSIPGRFLVMMPQMDKVGVSRKVEDEDQRRAMREILDQLDLPDGFGFILRTAGMERTKAELKRDLAYLMRLWKDMETKWKGGSKPRLLYSESDLLVRALRDFLTAEIAEIVVDNEAALKRAARFLKIVSPRTTTTLSHYSGKTPIFHVMGIEEQIRMIHSREVPLASGGRLVIDETEALVAIDVNSGKSRDARDSETNAYETNLEAVDEICRQLRLRDLGGVVVNDLIDMRSAKHRRDIENRFRENLKNDRARSSVAPISEFGILEMTRQRMRASHESQHFTPCPMCHGRGLVQRPDSVAGDAMRNLASLLDTESVAKVEMVVSPRIASELLSTTRRALSRLERMSGKHVDVRVSESIPVDRVDFYAYDDRGADLEMDKIRRKKPDATELVQYQITSDAAEEESWAEQAPAEPAREPEYDGETTHEDEDPHPIELEPLSLRELNVAQRRAQAGQRAPADQGGRGQPRTNQPGMNQDRSFGGPVGAEGDFAPGEGGRKRRRRRRGGRGRGRDGEGSFEQRGYAQGQHPQGGFPQEQFGPDGQPWPANAQFDAHGAPIEGPYSADAYNPEDQEAYEADPNHAVGFGTHHHQHGPQAAYDQRGYDQGGYGPGGNEQGYEQGDDQGHYAQQGPPTQGYGGFPAGNGQPGEFGEQGDGTGRRRRRRRRGGRGRGRGQGPGAPGQFGQDQYGNPYPQGDGYGQGPDGQARDGQFDGDQGPDGYVEGPYVGEPQPAAGGYAPPESGMADDFEAPMNPEAGPDGGPDGGGDSDGQPRRRRRRGGRGRGRDGERPAQGGPRTDGNPSLAAMFRTSDPVTDTDAGAYSDAPEPVSEAPVEAIEPPADDRGGSGRGRGRGRGGRGRGRARDSEGKSGGESDTVGEKPAAPAPKPVVPKAPGPTAVAPTPVARTPEPKPEPAQPKIRTLYSSRRRLAPGDVKGSKRDE